jgi:hypothetical protein
MWGVEIPESGIRDSSLRHIPPGVEQEIAISNYFKTRQYVMQARDGYQRRCDRGN